MIPVSIETLIVGLPPSPSVIVLRPLGDAHADISALTADDAPDTPDSSNTPNNPETATPPHNADSSRVLPIWIGPTEAAAIGIAIEGHERLRPMTHDLLADVIFRLNADIKHVLISHTQGTTFFATIVLSQNNQLIAIDARPSDSIALAVRAGSPMFVGEDVFASASVPYVADKSNDQSANLDEFRRFLETVQPEDFQA